MDEEGPEAFIHKAWSQVQVPDLTGICAYECHPLSFRSQSLRAIAGMGNRAGGRHKFLHSKHLIQWLCVRTWGLFFIILFKISVLI